MGNWRVYVTSAALLFFVGACGGGSQQKSPAEEAETAAEFDGLTDTVTPERQPLGRTQNLQFQRKPATPAPNSEQYEWRRENGFVDPLVDPLSTFSIDVDGASYSNVRRFINDGTLPPPDAVRIEEFLNYFTYDYPTPDDGDPFAVAAEVGPCPWNSQARLVNIALQAQTVDAHALPAAHLVFLVDVSGSMSDQNKLPLLKSGLRLLVNELRPQDFVSIVTYASNVSTILRATSGANKRQILAAIDRLNANGSTAGAAGIQRAYEVAREHFIPSGNNRVILATDGDFNVGISDDLALERFISTKRDRGVFLTILGFGMGNYKDAKMERLSNAGDGSYYYIDNLLEAQKTLVTEFGGSLHTVAKDVKAQVEFNPALVTSYRLVGYENRVMSARDFNDDHKDAGDLGSGQRVTALYEIVPRDFASDPYQNLRYQSSFVSAREDASGELLTVKIRFKRPSGGASALREYHVTGGGATLGETSADFRFAAAVAEFGLLLSDSHYKAQADFARVVALAERSRGADAEGYRAEFIRLARAAANLAQVDIANARLYEF